MDGWINKQESGHGFTERQHPIRKRADGLREVVE
jgi:hypothetical protein